MRSMLELWHTSRTDPVRNVCHGAGHVLRSRRLPRRAGPSDRVRRWVRRGVAPLWRVRGVVRAGGVARAAPRCRPDGRRDRDPRRQVAQGRAHRDPPLPAVRPLDGPNDRAVADQRAPGRRQRRPAILHSRDDEEARHRRLVRHRMSLVLHRQTPPRGGPRAFPAPRSTVTVTLAGVRARPVGSSRARPRGVSYAERLAKKYGFSVKDAEARLQSMTEVARADGLTFRFDLVRSGNTFDAHRVLHLAAERGVQDAVKERFLRGYMTEGEPIGDRETLVRLAAQAGLDAEEVRATLATDAHAAAVRAGTRPRRAASASRASPSSSSAGATRSPERSRPICSSTR